MKKKKILYIILGILLLGLIIFLLTKIPKREFNTFEFPSTIKVVNLTSVRMADTVIMVALNKVMGYDTMEIQILPLHSTYKNEFLAIIMKIEYQEHRYNIFLNPSITIPKMVDVMSHELIHLRQHESGIFQVLPDNYGYVWKGDTTKYSSVKYEDRPYEVEAFRESPNLKHKINKILYK